MCVPCCKQQQRLHDSSGCCAFVSTCCRCCCKLHSVKLVLHFVHCQWHSLHFLPRPLPSPLPSPSLALVMLFWLVLVRPSPNSVKVLPADCVWRRHCPKESLSVCACVCVSVLVCVCHSTSACHVAHVHFYVLFVRLKRLSCG